MDSKYKMKFKIVLLFITVCLFWTCVHRPGGSLDYQLILKPYPTFLLEVGGGEEGSYKRRMLQGEFPNWLASGNYKIINSGSLESPTQYWEYLRGLILVSVFTGWIIMITSLLTKVLKAIYERLCRG